jgi:putative phosphoribosyl transferase
MRNQATTFDKPREVAVGARRLGGLLAVPPQAKGLVLFAHGSGSGRYSPRNQYVAGVLRSGGIATLLFDLLSDAESDDRRKVFDIELLAERLQEAAEWTRQQPETNGLSLGYFGASTGSAAALVAAARQGDAVSAVVSRGGRPDLADHYLPRVTAPTLLIVGGSDDVVVDLNRTAYAQLRCPKQLAIVPGATHLFPEPGALEEVARLASEWFSVHLRADEDARGTQKPK